MMKREEKSAGLERLLGPEFADEPSSAQLAAYLAGELDDPALAKEAAAFLLQNARVAERLRAALKWAEALDKEEDAPRHALLYIATPKLRAAAASQQQDALPVPDERQVLIDEGGLRVVYLREGERAQLGLFRDASKSAREELALRLDGEAPPVLVSGDETRIFDLGPARSLAGRELEFERAGHSWRWLLVEDSEA